MKKTVLRQAIEKLEETLENTRGIQKNYSEKGSMHWIHKANGDLLEVNLSLLRSLLPREEQQIKDAYNSGSASRTATDEYTTATGNSADTYFTTTYKTPQP